ncbi:hypothetical protein Efla_000369 [Eimeria flavescens]
MASLSRGPLRGAPLRLMGSNRQGAPRQPVAPRACSAAKWLQSRALHEALPQATRPQPWQQPAGAAGAAASPVHAAAAAPAVTASAAAATRVDKSNPAVEASACLAPLLPTADVPAAAAAAARSAAAREALALFAAAVEAAEAAGGPPVAYLYDLRDPLYRQLLRGATPATPAAAAATASPAGAALGEQQHQQQQQMWCSELGSPFYVLLLQALHAAAAAANASVGSSGNSNTPRNSSSSNSSSSSSSNSSDANGALEAAGAEVAALWQLQVNKDLRCLRLKAAAALQPPAAAAAPAAAASAATAAAAREAHADELQLAEVEAAATRLLSSAAEAAALLAELQLRHSVRAIVPTLLLILERVRLSRPSTAEQQQQQKQQQQQQQQQQQLEELKTAVSLSGGCSAAGAAAAAAARAATAATAGVQCLHALGRCQLFSEQLLGVVSADFLIAMGPDCLALYLFECGRMGLRCKRWIDASIERAAAAAQEMSAPSLLLAAAGAYRFCVDCRVFYEKAAPRLIALLPAMDYYQLRLMLRLVKHLDPAFGDAALRSLAKGAAKRLEEKVPFLEPQQLCCIATFVERRCLDTPAEFASLTRALVAALEAGGPSSSASAQPPAAAAAAGGGGGEAAADDPLALVHPIHDLVDVVDCMASHGLQSPLASRIERILATRFSEIEHSVNFTLWLVCLDAFSRLANYRPRALLLRVTDSLCSNSSNSNTSSSSSSNALEAPSLLDSLSVVQKLKFMQALTRLSFFSPSVAQMWCRSVEEERSLFKSLRDAMTCVFPLARGVYVHPVVFERAARFVDSRCSSSRRFSGLYPSESRHLEFFILSHVCWSFLVAEMHAKPFFRRLLDRTLAAAPSFGGPAGGPGGGPNNAADEGPCSTAAAAGAAAEGASSSNGEPEFRLPWRLRDAGWLAHEEASGEAAAAAGGSAAAAAAAAAPAAAAAASKGWAVTPCNAASALSALDVISYRRHCEPLALLQQTCRLVLLEAPQLLRSVAQPERLRGLAESVVRWKADREADVQLLLQEVSAAAAAAGVQLIDSRQGGGPPSPALQWGHLWPFSEVSLWAGGVPLILLSEADGLLLHAAASSNGGQPLFFNTGFKFLLLKAFRALGQPKSVACLSVCLYVCPSFACLPVCLSVCPSVVCLSMCLPVIRLSVCLSVLLFPAVSPSLLHLVAHLLSLNVRQPPTSAIPGAVLGLSSFCFHFVCLPSLPRPEALQAAACLPACMQVLFIDAQEWRAASSSPEQQQSFLRSRLGTLGAPPSPP